MAFDEIISGNIHSFKIAEDDSFLAILESSPLAIGHTVIFPKRKVESIFYLEDEVFSDMLLFAKNVALNLESAIPCLRIGMAVIGLEVAHAHVHLIPLQTVEDINFTRKKLSPSNHELNDIHQQIIHCRNN